VRRLNGRVLGASTDLDQFLFGAERAPLGKYLPILREVEEGRCLYCERQVGQGMAHSDHFIPWSRYPIDLGHNFVLTHGTYNAWKAEHLAASIHLRKWIERNHSAGEYLRDRFDKGHIVHNAETSEQIAYSAYSQAAWHGFSTGSFNQ
jgi:hypothetical protein